MEYSGPPASETAAAKAKLSASTRRFIERASERRKHGHSSVEKACRNKTNVKRIGRNWVGATNQFPYVGLRRGLSTRILRSVHTTKQRSHSATFSLRNNSVIRSINLARLGVRRRTSRIPLCEPGANDRVSEKSRSWVIRNLDSSCAARQISASGRPMPCSYFEGSGSPG